MRYLTLACLPVLEMPLVEPRPQPAPRSQHIALFTDKFSGGAQQSMVRLATAFHQQGRRVDFLTARDQGPLRQDLHPGIRVINFEAPRLIRTLPGLMGYLRREHPDVMLSSPLHANVVALLSRRLVRCRTKVAIREAAIPSREAVESRLLQYRLAPRLYGWADAVIAISPGVKADLESFAPRCISKVHILPNPTLRDDVERRLREPLDHPWFAAGEPPVVLGIGRLAREKDYPTLIRAFACLRQRQQARLVILGEGPQRAALSALASSLGIADAVAMPGYDTNPFRYLARAAVFVLTSTYEGFGNVLVEALAAGIPIVATNCPGGPAYILDQGRYGRLVDSADPESLAAAIAAALAAPPSPADVGDRRRRAATFSIERSAHRYLDLLDEL